MENKKFIVLDVEGCANARPYNVGYIIADKHNKIYKKRSIVFPSTYWENLQRCISDRYVEEMTHKNIQEILTDSENGILTRKYKPMGIDNFYKMFVKDVNKYDVSEMWAYNVNFDKSALNRLFGERFNNIELEYKDIIPAILHTKLMTKKYINFCRDNNFVTEKGNIQTKVETVYRYLTGCIDFEEEHTGLTDVLIEYQILLTAFNTKKKIFYKPCQAWRELNKFIKEKNI